MSDFDPTKITVKRCVIITAPADGRFCVKGSYFDKVCALCGRRVQISPLTRKAGHEAHSTIICSRCYVPTEGDVMLMPGSIEQVKAEMMTAVPNFWRLRN